MNTHKTIFDLLNTEQKSSNSLCNEADNQENHWSDFNDAASMNYFIEKDDYLDDSEYSSVSSPDKLSFDLRKESNSFNQKIKINNSIYKESDFKKISRLGNGAYGQVFKIKNKETNELFALKEINKSLLKKEEKYYQIQIENYMMQICSHRNIAKYYGSFENKNYFWIIEEYCPYGDLSSYLSENKFHLTTEEIQYIIAQMITCLEYLSTKNIIHRDIKPENFLITENFTLKLIDFATATFLGKVFDEKKNEFIDDNFQKLKKSENCSFMLNNNVNFEQSFHQIDELDPCKSFCQNKLTLPIPKIDNNTSFSSKQIEKIKRQKFVGTVEYMAPEVINSQRIGYYTDMWSLMCVLFLCYTGHTPFNDETDYLVFQNTTRLKFNEKYINIIPDEARDLILSFFKVDPYKRIGFNNYKDYDFNAIKSHPFFYLRDEDVTLEEIVKKLLDKCKKYKIKKKETDNGENKNWENKGNKEENEKNQEIGEDKNIKILKCGLLKKQSPYYYYDLRKIVLDDTPKVTYIEPEKMIIKGIINLNKECSAELIKSNQFKLITPKRTFIFMCKEKYDITPWVLAINSAIEKYSG